MQQALPKVEEIFYAALELESPEARSAFLDRACGTAELRRKVERLLALDVEENDFLKAPASVPTVTAAHESRWGVEEPGTAIGPYRLLEAIGEGGMGVVFVAEQAEPVRRRVALKVIKPGMDSKQVVARFEAERQALAMMDHPNIAKVHDAGMTASGRPYFVMELVHGLPLTEYCDREELSIPERLELFVLVCRAVQHAHQKGIIHRDLKPSNVLVTVVDGVPTPKVIDFGVAKATGQALTDKTVYTGFHQFVGTPLYASPEQADLASTDVDTRSDIYSLGVLLYELLTGTTPFDSETLKKAAFDEMRRIIREEEPPRPSTRLSSLGKRLSTVSAHRRADPKRLGSAVKGELDWVVMKALEKDRRRRYETANDFAADVMNYLADRPVEACPPSARYRFAKFARRNRLALAAAGFVGAALSLAVVVLAVSAVLIAQERDEAQRQRKVARKAVDEMYTQVAKKWLGDQPGLTPVQMEFLEKALAFYEQFAAARDEDPELRLASANASKAVGDIRFSLGKVDESVVAHRQAVAECEALVGQFPDVAPYRHELAHCLLRFGLIQAKLGRLSESELLLRRAYELREGLCNEAPENVEYQRGFAAVHQALGSTCNSLGRDAEAEQLLRRGMELFESVLKKEADNPVARNDENAIYTHGDAAITAMSLGNALGKSKRFEQAERAYLRSVELLESLLAKDPKPRDRKSLAITLVNLGNLQAQTRRLDEAIGTHRRAESLLASLAEESPQVVAYGTMLLGCRRNLCADLDSAGRFAETAEVGNRGIELGERLAHDYPSIPEHQGVLRVLLLREADRETYYPEGRSPDPSHALKLVSRALELKSDIPLQETDAQSLAWARYRAGDWQGCIDCLEEQPWCQTEGNFVGAMAHWRLGEQAKAREVFERTDRWLAGYETRWHPGIYPSPQMLRRIRGEAASLLELEAASPEVRPARPTTDPEHGKSPAS